MCVSGVDPTAPDLTNLRMLYHDFSTIEEGMELMEDRLGKYPSRVTAVYSGLAEAKRSLKQMIVKLRLEEENAARE